MSNRWFAFGKIISRYRLKARIQKGSLWQLYEVKGGGRLLVVKDELNKHWIKDGLIGENFFSLVLDEETSGYFYFFSSPGFAVGSISEGDPFASKETARAFKRALKRTRDCIQGIPLADAIFIEKYELLLPTYEYDNDDQDDVLLGMWLSGGVRVSANDSDRISSLSAVLTKQDMHDLMIVEGKHTSKVKIKDTQQQKKEVSKDKFELPGRPELETFINDHIVDIIRNEERYKRMGIEFPGAVILYGPPGCGKTYAVERLVDFLGWPLHTISSSSIGSPYIHDTSKKIAEIFDQAMKDAPSVIVIDEMEAYMADRESSGYSGSHQMEEVAEFLRRIPEATKNHVLVFGMTNLIEKVDPAIQRRGRFDHVIEVGMPSPLEVKSLLDHLLRDIPTEASLDRDWLASMLGGHAVSDTAFVVKEACRIAAKEGAETVNQNCFEKALSSLPNKEKEERNPIGFIWN